MNWQSFFQGAIAGYLVAGIFMVLWAISAGVWKRMVEYIMSDDDTPRGNSTEGEASCPECGNYVWHNPTCSRPPVLAGASRRRVTDEDEYKKLYYELIYEVVKKIPGMTRHERARSIIRDHEQPQNNPTVRDECEGKGEKV